MRFKRCCRNMISCSSLVLLLILIGCRSQAATMPATATPLIESPPTNKIQSSTPDSNSERRTSAPAGVWLSPEENPGRPDSALEVDMYAVSAPEFPPDLEWLNTDTSLTLAQLKGKVVILIFWSYDCIDCVYSFQDLKRLAQDYPDDLVIIGVHAFRSDTEVKTEDIRQAISSYEIDYPVINDHNLRLWYEWGIKATPALIIIDPIGAIYGFHTGEDVYGTFKPIVQLLTQAYQ